MIKIIHDFDWKSSKPGYDANKYLTQLGHESVVNIVKMAPLVAARELLKYSQ